MNTKWTKSLSPPSQKVKVTIFSFILSPLFYLGCDAMVVPRCPFVNFNLISNAGCEWRYVILSTVRSLLSKDIEIEPDRAWRSKHVGFVGDPNQINVGITRAKEGLCIIGEQDFSSRA